MNNKTGKALLTLFYFVNIIAVIGGAIILILFYFKSPSSQISTWKLGQAIMFYGIINTAIMIGLSIAKRKS